ncbi:MAG: hypothetical protein OHK0012_14330 [Synechococcales cyanobacterium]
MRHTWWQRLGLWLSIFGILIFTACGSPTTVAVVPPTATTDTSTSVSTTVRVAKSAGFALDYRVTSQWGNGFTAEVTIHNTSPDPIPAWTLNWTFPQDPTQITNLWNGTVSQTSTQVTVSNLSHNSVIPAGGSVNFGFQASYPGGDLTTPVAFIFNGQPLAQPTPTPASLACLVDYTVSSSWNEGFVANLTIRNLGGSVTGWELGFDFPVDGVSITNLWNGTITQTGRTVHVTNLDWNKTIPANGTASVGFQAAHSGGSVTPTGFRLNGVPCTGQPATPIPSAPPIPANSIVILNAEVVDGTPYTIGQTIELNAAARNANNQDISNQITWTNTEGQTLGTGSRLTYSAQTPKAETLTAQVTFNGTEKKAQVSFTVSPEDILLQPYVKPLADEVRALIETWDPIQGSLILRQDPTVLPTLHVGDVLVGAQYRIPPFQVLSLSAENNRWLIQGQLALPKDVIKQGYVSHWQRVLVAADGTVRSLESVGRSGDCNGIDINRSLPISIFDAPTSTYELPLPFGIKALRPTLSLGLNVTADAQARFCGQLPIPTNESVIFKDTCELWGLCRLRLQAGMADFSAAAGVNLNGTLEWGLSGRFPPQPVTLIDDIPLLVGTVPPVSFWLKVDVLGSVLVDAGAGVQVQGRAGLTYEGGRALVTLQYDGEEWSVDRDFAAGVLSRELTGDLDVYGFLQVGLNPEIGMTVWGGVGGPNAVGVDLLSLPKIGLNLYLRGELYPEPDEIAVTITSPQDGATLDTNQPVTFNANAVGNPLLKLKAGVELTLRDGSVEECSQEANPQSKTREATTDSCDDSPPYDPFPLPRTIESFPGGHDQAWDCGELINWALSRGWKSRGSDKDVFRYWNKTNKYILLLRTKNTQGAPYPHWGIRSTLDNKWVEPYQGIQVIPPSTDIGHSPLLVNQETCNER